MKTDFREPGLEERGLDSEFAAVLMLGSR